MTITLDIKPEVQAELARQAAVQGRPVEAVAAALLESVVHPMSAQQSEHASQALIDAFAEIGGFLSDEEIDRMFTRNPAGARPVDLS